MRIEIDQSIKLENTNQDTIIAFSNHCLGSILIRARDKRELQKFFRRIGKHKIFIYRLFAILIYILIKKHLKDINEIVIDQEYPGKSALIKDFLLREIKKVRPHFPKENIFFKLVGKKSKAHYLAYGVQIGKKLPDREANYKEILKFLIK